MPSLPPEITSVQQLITRYGVSGTLVLIATECRDRSIKADIGPHERRATAQFWEQRARVIEHCLHSVRELESQDVPPSPLQ